jgi:hypothetical protein
MEAEDVETNAKYSGFLYSLNALFVAKNMIEPVEITNKVQP